LVDALVRREPLVAALALTSAANRVRLFALSRIDHSILGKTAVGTLHRNALILAVFPLGSRLRCGGLGLLAGLFALLSHLLQVHVVDSSAQQTGRNDAQKSY